MLAGKRKIKCRMCGACCNHVAVEIDKPLTPEDRDAITWYLMHRNVKVFVDHEGDWYIEFYARCDGLGRKNQCRIYESRPDICKDYDPSDCVRGNPCEGEKISFTKREEFLEYLKSEDREKTRKKKQSKNVKSAAR